MSLTRQHLRRQLRAARRALSPVQQRAAAVALACQLRSFLPLRACRHVAFYLPNDGEIDPRPLVRELARAGVSCYLPRLHMDGSHRVWFIEYREGDALENNRYGIPEPMLGRRRCLSAWALQAVLMPLVGFDRSGNRLGMGGGFYDRTFAFRRERQGCRPLLVGLAHALQEVPGLPVESWDMPLDVIATDQVLIDLRYLS